MPYTDNTLDTDAVAQYIQLVTFSWAGGATTATYAASDKSYSTFVACPALSVTFDKQTGGVQDEPCTILMPVVDPVATMLTGYPFSRCFVTIEEIDISDVTTRRKLFYGIISQCTGNKNNNANLVEIKVAGLRSFLEYPLGVPAMNTCAWQFGDKNCSVLPANVIRTILSISGTTLTFTAAINAGDFNRGKITFAGLSLMIRSQTSTTVVEMVNIPPPAWVGASVTVTPGCRKTLVDCAKWVNTLNFGGFGIAIPSFHPSVETQ